MFEEDEIGKLLGSEGSLSDKGAELAKMCEFSGDNNTAFLIEIESINRQDDEISGSNISYDIQQPQRNFFGRLIKYVQDMF